MTIDGTGCSKFNVKAGGFTPTFIVLHHSFSADGKTRNWDAIRKYHMSFRYQGEIITEHQYAMLEVHGERGLERPWTDIGYQLGVEMVDDKLQVMNGRAIGSVGAHAHGFNAKSIGICLIGNYDAAPPDDDRMFVLSSLVRELMRMFSIPVENVLGHRETYVILGTPVEKTCPGAKFDLAAFRARLETNAAPRKEEA